MSDHQRIEAFSSFLKGLANIENFDEEPQDVAFRGRSSSEAEDWRSVRPEFAECIRQWGQKPLRIHYSGTAAHEDHQGLETLLDRYRSLDWSTDLVLNFITVRKQRLQTFMTLDPSERTCLDAWVTLDSMQDARQVLFISVTIDDEEFYREAGEDFGDNIEINIRFAIIHVAVVGGKAVMGGQRNKGSKDGSSLSITESSSSLLTALTSEISVGA